MKSLYAGLAADELGRPDSRPALVLLHGLPFDRTSWGPVIEALTELDPGRHVLAVDLPGHGDSVKRADYGLEAVADHVRRAVDEAGLDSPILVGHSISGSIASIYAARYATSGVVNVDSSLRVEQFAGLLHSLAGRLDGDGFDEIWRTIFWPSMKTELLPLSAQELLRASCRPERELVLGYWRDALDRTPAEVAAWAAQGISTVRARRIPYLIVAGDELEPSYRAWLAAELPHATITVIPHSGHFPQLKDPAMFAECLVAFADWSGAWSYVA